MTLWRKRTWDAAAGVTEYPAGPRLADLAPRQRIQVTQPNYDNVGQVLTALGVPFERYTGDFDCDLLFLNCGSADLVPTDRLREYVHRGGYIYASDLTSHLLTTAFPGVFRFPGRSGSSGMVTAKVADDELAAIIGSSLPINFNMGGWSILESAEGTTLLRAAEGTPYARLPLMVEVPVGEGAVYYTCFHNHAQASDKESALLKLLVLKQIGRFTRQSVAQVGRTLGISLASLTGNGSAR